MTNASHPNADGSLGLARYHRQALLPGVGEEGQRRLLASHALIVGCGALGCTAADLLCRAGVGTITIVDRDFVELTNLQRQTLFDESDAALAMPKAEAARKRLEKVNSGVGVRAVVNDFNHRSAERILGGGSQAVRQSGRQGEEEEEVRGAQDRGAQGGGEKKREGAPAVGVLVDGTDNFETRYLMNDIAVAWGIPYVYAGVVGTTGMQMTVLPRSAKGAEQVAGGTSGRAVPARAWAGFDTPCLRCLFEQAPPAGTTPTCDTAGVLGPAVSIVAGFEAAEAIKVLLGRWAEVSRALLTLDVWTNEVRRIDVSGAVGEHGETGGCACCGRGEFPYLAGEGMAEITRMCGRNSVQIAPRESESGDDPRLDLARLATTLGAHGAFVASAFMVRGVLERERGESGEAIELAVFADGRAIVKGTTKAEVARSIYAKYVGG